MTCELKMFCVLAILNPTVKYADQHHMEKEILGLSDTHWSFSILNYSKRIHFMSVTLKTQYKYLSQLHFNFHTFIPEIQLHIYSIPSEGKV